MPSQHFKLRQISSGFIAGLSIAKAYFTKTPHFFQIPEKNEA